MQVTDQRADFESLKNNSSIISRPYPFENQKNYFYGHGKLLLTGEYLIMDGAKSIGLPTILGQSLSVKRKPTFGTPKLKWKSYDYKSSCWFDVEFELWNFELTKNSDKTDAIMLRDILRVARELNPHFLREEGVDTIIETRLEFPLQWGLGSSSTLLYNIAQWAYISPFKFSNRVFEGASGYDIACAQSLSPILYNLDEKKHPAWKIKNFNPAFKENLYFVYSGQKQKTSVSIDEYRSMSLKAKFVEETKRVSEISEEILKTDDFKYFCSLIEEHEDIISKVIGQSKIKEKFKDFDGSIKSLGAWGGDFFLVASSADNKSIKKYFNEKGLDTVINYKDLICDQFITSSQKNRLH